LCDQNVDRFVRLVKSVGEVRHPEGPRDHPLWRLYPERWLETLVLQNVTAIDERLDPSTLYSQVPAFSAADRGMLDVLCASSAGTQGRRRYSPSSARNRLLVAGRVASRARRIQEIRL